MRKKRHFWDVTISESKTYMFFFYFPSPSRNHNFKKLFLHLVTLTTDPQKAEIQQYPADEVCLLYSQKACVTEVMGGLCVNPRWPARRVLHPKTWQETRKTRAAFLHLHGSSSELFNKRASGLLLKCSAEFGSLTCYVTLFTSAMHYGLRGNTGNSWD